MSVSRGLLLLATATLSLASFAAFSACEKSPQKTGEAGEPEAAASAEPSTQPTPAAPKAFKVADLKVVGLPGLRKHMEASGAKLTVVAMWATWCGPCIEEMAHLNAFYAAHKGQGVDVVGLCTDDRAMMGGKIQKVLDKTGVSYGQFLLEPGSEDAIMKGIGEAWDGMLPKTFVLGSDGKKRAFFAQAVDEKVLAEKVLVLLDGQ